MRFSIITVCKNPGHYLSEAMTSVLNQGHADIEYVVIDGGSSDGTLAMISAAATKNARLSWYSGPDKGIADAMNRGISSTHGEIVAFLHADDRYPNPEILRAVDEIFATNSKAFWVTGGVREIDHDGRLIRELPVRIFSYRRLLRNNILFHPATFVRREIFELVGGFDAGLRYAMDYDLWLRLGRLAPPVAIDRVLAEFRVHPGSLSSSSRRAALEEEYLVRRRYARGWLGRIGHVFYQSLRQLNC
jgi:glycosyltransferase involved in cell wall biosynthesis